MSLNDLSEPLKQKLMFGAISGKTIKFATDDEVLYVDTNESPYEMTLGKDDEADVTMRASLDTFQNILNGIQDPNMAFMTGKLKVSGSMGFAMKLASVLED